MNRKIFAKTLLFSLVFFFIPGISSIFASSCEVKGKKGVYYLLVDGRPFELKGVGCAEAKGIDGADYFAMARELGANTVRTWGIDQGNEEYLTLAEKNGLKVDAGIWLPHCNWQRKKKTFSYIADIEKLKQIENDALEYVKKFKDHPSVILWNIGNEVLFFTNEEKEKLAFCSFLQSLVKKIKQIDSTHPILYTCASTSNLKYLKKVKGLDLIGFNTYGGVEHIHEEWKDLEFDIPYLITEFGPKGPWDMPKDFLKKSIDQADYEKAFNYQIMMEEGFRLKGSCLGMFAFHLGDTTQESLTWWNINYENCKRESFHVVRKFFTGSELPNKPPVCTKLKLNKYVVASGETLSSQITAYDREKDELSYEILVSTTYENIMKHRVNEVIQVEVQKKKDHQIDFKAPINPGIYRLNAFVYDGAQNVAVRSVCFEVKSA